MNQHRNFFQDTELFNINKPKNKPNILKVFGNVLRWILLIGSLVTFFWGFGTLFFNSNVGTTSVTVYDFDKGIAKSIYPRGTFLEFVAGAPEGLINKSHLFNIKDNVLYEYPYFSVNNISEAWDVTKSPLYSLFVLPISFLLNKIAELFSWSVENIGKTSNLLAAIGAIFVTSLLLKIISGYGSYKQQKNKEKMDAVKFKTDAIKLKYSDNKSREAKQQMQTEIMALYRKENINPLVTALEGFLFAPLLFVMFIVIRGSIFLKNSSTENFTLIVNIWGSLQTPMLVYYIAPIIIYSILYLIDNLLLPRLLKPKQIHKPIKQNKKNNIMQGPALKWVTKIFFFAIFFIVPTALSIYWMFNLFFDICQKLILAFLKEVKKEKAIAIKKGVPFKIWNMKLFGKKQHYENIAKKTVPTVKTFIQS